MLIKKYTSEWIEDFKALRYELESGLQGVEVQIEHVGSTSIPGLASKPIIDIDIIYSDQRKFEMISSLLSHMGYYHNGNQGVHGREVFKRNPSKDEGVLDRIKHHLYVCDITSNSLENHILFRNHLRKNKEKKLQYETLKYELAHMAHQHQKVYAILKDLVLDEFITSVVESEKSNKKETIFEQVSYEL